MSKQEANIYEIAKEAGVSIATVSRVMNHSCTVSEKSRKRVLEAVEKLNYVPNSAARSLSTSTSTSVGVVIPDTNNPFFSRLLQRREIVCTPGIGFGAAGEGFVRFSGFCGEETAKIAANRLQHSAAFFSLA